MTTEEILKLAKKIAKKTRRLIPRSANRIAARDESGSEDVDKEGFANDSMMADAYQRPAYSHLLLLAQRARSERNLGRKKILDAALKATEGQLRLRGKEQEDDLNNRFFELHGGQIEELEKLEQQMAGSSRGLKKEHKSKGWLGWKKAYEPMEKIEADAKNAIRFQIGNCEENSSLAFLMFAEYPIRDDTIWIRKIYDSKGLHAFVVIDRKGSDPVIKDEILAPDCIVCDPWSFHEGDAFIPVDPDTWDSKGLSQKFNVYILENEFKVASKIQLGAGHSARFRNSKYKDLNYLELSEESLKKTLVYDWLKSD